MTTLEALSLPGLVIAPDGWVRLIRAAADLARWNSRSLRRYNRIGLFVLDAEGRGWRSVSLHWTDHGFVERTLARLTGRPLPTIVHLEPVGEPGLPEAKRRLYHALEIDDDVLTQFATREVLRRAIEATQDAGGLMDAMAQLGVAH